MDAERLGERLTALLTNSENRSKRLRNQVWIRHRCEVHEPHAIGILANGAACHLQRETRFPDPARTAQRDEPRIAQRNADLRNFPPTSDETCQLMGQVPSAYIATVGGRARDRFPQSAGDFGCSLESLFRRLFHAPGNYALEIERYGRIEHDNACRCARD